jgi:signal transduction histidine kinase
MTQVLQILFIEDSEDDVVLLLRHLKKGGFDARHERVDSASGLETALQKQRWDLAVSDFHIPGFGGMEALAIVRSGGFDMPFILVSGLVGEEVAVGAIKAGAQDFVSKEHPERLCTVVERELEAVRSERERSRAQSALQESERRHRELSLRLREEIERREDTESRLRRAQKLEAVGQLAAGVAHEINSPVQYIMDNTAYLKVCFTRLIQLVECLPLLLKEANGAAIDPDLITRIETMLQDAKIDVLVEDVPVAIDETLDGLERVANIVRSMGEFAHPAAKGKTGVDLNRLIENTLTLSRNEWKYVARVETSLDPDLPLVSCNPDAIGQAILNIVVNATHAVAHNADTGKPSGVITITTRSVGECTEIRIQDNGHGMSPEVEARIFEPFFTTKEVGKGSGQGLALAYSYIVTEHQGTLQVETSPGQGAAFIIRLPKGDDEVRVVQEAHDRR